MHAPCLLLCVLLGCPLVGDEEWNAANDRDGDGYLAQVNGGDDCDDGDAQIHPAAEERCDGADNDCDGQTDEQDAVDASPWYADADGDGYGAGEAQWACQAPQQHVSEDGDCDEGDEAVHPDAAEICDDGLDNDCDGGLNDCGLYGSMELLDADAVHLGEGSGDLGDWAGRGLAGPGDVDGDGLDDLLVGAPYRDADAEDVGMVYLARGFIRGTHSLADAYATIKGQGEHSTLGYAVAGAGDVDGDGNRDILAGAQGGASAFLFLGPMSGALGLDEAAASFYGEESMAGYAVAGAGDVNGDGHDDLLVGAPLANLQDATEAPGAAHLLLGPLSGDMQLRDADASLLGESGNDSAGDCVAGIGDSDGDGLQDLAVGAPFATSAADETGGVAYLVPGPLKGELQLSDRGYRLTAELDGDRAGDAVAGAGDVNGDGYTDLLVAATQARSGGEPVGVVYLVTGPQQGDSCLTSAKAAMAGLATDDWTGWSVCGAGDLNQDGLADVFIGAPESDTSGLNAGAAFLVYGPISGGLALNEADANFTGVNEEDYAGGMVAAGGDLNGDGLGDLLLSAYGYKLTGDLQDGAVYVVLGEGL